LRAEDGVEGFGEFAVAVEDQDPRPSLLVNQGHKDLARLPRGPVAVRMGGDTGNVNAAPLELDEEDVVAAQPDGVDSEEVALDDCGRLLAQELAPADIRASRCGVDAVAPQDVPHRAGGHEWATKSCLRGQRL
jgi:hypothetical protein